MAPPLGFENIAQAIAAAVPTAISTTASTALIVTPSRNVPSVALESGVVDSQEQSGGIVGLFRPYPRQGLMRRLDGDRLRGAV